MESASKLLVKVEITTKCGFRCTTCPGWKREVQTMPPSLFSDIVRHMERFRDRWEMLFVNSTGDFYSLPDPEPYLKVIESTDLPVNITTNGLHVTRLPHRKVLFIISLNGADEESYMAMTGMPYAPTAARIRALYPFLARNGSSRLHCLVCSSNAGKEALFLEQWKDFPGTVQFSYKYDNQGLKDDDRNIVQTPARIPCDYLTRTVSIDTTGRIRLCSHDWTRSEDLGNFTTMYPSDILFHPARIRYLSEHMKSSYPGICAHCTYNTPMDGRIRKIRNHL